VGGFTTGTPSNFSRGSHIFLVGRCGAVLRGSSVGGKQEKPKNGIFKKEGEILWGTVSQGET